MDLTGRIDSTIFPLRLGQIGGSAATNYMEAMGVQATCCRS
jgi:hypothetical protein